jgi:hypothetical protein
LLAGLYLHLGVVPREHRIFYDEDIYQNIGQNITFLRKAGMCNEGANEYGEYRCYRLEYNKQPNAWPYLLSITFRLFGVHELAAFLTNNLIYGLSIVTVFLIGFLLFGNYVPGIYAAFIFALIPEQLIWSNSVAVEPSAALFLGLAVLSTLVFIKTRESKSLFLTVTVLAFAIQFRTESIVMVTVPVVIILLSCKNELKQGRLYLLLSIFFLLIIPHLIHLYAVKGEGWGSTGPKFAFAYFNENIMVNSLFYFKNIRFPLIFTILFWAGILLHQRRDAKVENRDEMKAKIRSFFPALFSWLQQQTYHWKEKWIIFIWFIISWGVFLFFYAGSYNYGVDVRFSLLSSMPLAILAGYGAGAIEYQLVRRLRLPWMHGILASLIIFSFVSFLPVIRAITQEAWGARADHHFAQMMAKEVPPGALILTHNPNMFLLWQKSAAQASLATEHPSYSNNFFSRYYGGVYFHFNFWCNVADPLQNSFCTNILEKYNCTPIISFKERSYNYVLYKVAKKGAKR